MEKIFNQKNFYNFIWSLLGSRGNIYINFCLQVHFQVSAAWYCSNYFSTDVNDTGGKFAASVVDTGGNLPPASLTPVVHLDLRISPRIFEKIWNDPNVIIRGLGEDDSWEKPEAKKSRDTVCAADFSLLNLPKGKSLGRSKPATNS